jgi:hypothetical protein
MTQLRDMGLIEGPRKISVRHIEQSNELITISKPEM